VWKVTVSHIPSSNKHVIQIKISLLTEWRTFIKLQFMKSSFKKKRSWLHLYDITYFKLCSHFAKFLWRPFFMYWNMQHLNFRYYQNGIPDTIQTTEIPQPLLTPILWMFDPVHYLIYIWYRTRDVPGGSSNPICTSTATIQSITYGYQIRPQTTDDISHNIDVNTRNQPSLQILRENNLQKI
jgi:hypothetical protein